MEWTYYILVNKFPIDNYLDCFLFAITNIECICYLVSTSMCFIIISIK